MPNTQSDNPASEPNKIPKNKIEPHTIPTNYTPKNKIERPTLPPNYTPKNKIERHTLPPNYKPKNKIERPTLPPNYTPKNKIERPKLPPNYTPKNKIERAPIHQNDTPQNKKELEKNDPIQKTKNNETSGNAEVKTRQTLYNDGEKKECRLCHEIKSLNDFEKYMKSNKTVYERYCKPCRLEYKQVRALQNKNNIIRNIYGGKFAQKCAECNTTTAKLPAFDFHHPIKELKTK